MQSSWQVGVPKILSDLPWPCTLTLPSSNALLIVRLIDLCRTTQEPRLESTSLCPTSVVFTISITERCKACGRTLTATARIPD